MMGLLTHLARRYFEIAKEVLDILLGVPLFILSTPLLLICALMIKLSSKGPVFYTQTRMGKDGKPFKMYKLRTMYSEAEQHTGAVWCGDKDPRVLPLCRWMRRSHMDELPQLFNVLKGEMSLVGPRPERPEILEELEEVYPDIRKRLAVKPGITGLAQIRNGYDTTVDAFRHKLASDLEYIANRKWGTELRILLATMTKISDKAAK